MQNNHFKLIQIHQIINTHFQLGEGVWQMLTDTDKGVSQTRTDNNQQKGRGGPAPSTKFG